jgi:hypothetical protein
MSRQFEGSSTLRYDKSAGLPPQHMTPATLLGHCATQWPWPATGHVGKRNRSKRSRHVVEHDLLLLASGPFASSRVGWE